LIRTHKKQLSQEIFMPAKNKKNKNTRHYRFLAAASAIALALAAPAIAESTHSAPAEKTESISLQQFENIEHVMNGGDITDISYIDIDDHSTASQMIGSTVYSTDGERLAKVRDIILDKDGQAVMVILADGDWTGLGKLAAFDYSVIAQKNAQGDVISPLNEDMIDSAVSFSYDRNIISGATRVIPRGGYSTADMIGKDIVGPGGETVARVENVSIHDGQAHHLVVAYDQTLGLGGKKVVMGFGDAGLTNNDDGDLHFELSEAKLKKFRTYQNTRAD
jgi:sporulation protein YlmC with PRC-barrel domain